MASSPSHPDSAHTGFAYTGFAYTGFAYTVSLRGQARGLGLLPTSLLLLLPVSLLLLGGLWAVVDWPESGGWPAAAAALWSVGV